MSILRRHVLQVPDFPPCRCGGIVGLYFLVKRCAMLYLSAENGTFGPSPYLDIHGEVDLAMRSVLFSLYTHQRLSNRSFQTGPLAIHTPSTHGRAEKDMAKPRHSYVYCPQARADRRYRRMGYRLRRLLYLCTIAILLYYSFQY